MATNTNREIQGLRTPERWFNRTWSAWRGFLLVGAAGHRFESHGLMIGLIDGIIARRRSLDFRL